MLYTMLGVFLFATIIAALVACATKGVEDWGILWQSGAVWIGWHYSPYEKRVCINLIPCVTVWLMFEGGRIPKKVAEKRQAFKPRLYKNAYRPGPF